MHPLCSIYESPAWTQGITQIQEPALPAELISCPLNTSGMSGSLELKITPTITSYRSSLYRYTQIRLDYHAAITEFETSAAAEGTFPLSDIPSLPEGASLSFTAACDTAAKLNGSLSGTIGYYILNDSGIHSLTSVPRLRTSPALDGSAVFGLSMNVSNKTAQNTRLEMQAAVSGKASGHLSANASSISEHHDCTSCLEGTIVSKAELNFRAEQSDTGEHYTLQQSQQCQSGNFYLSSNGGASDSQSCPQHTYQVTFTVLDSSGNKVEHAAIQADNAMPAVSLNTDISGRASCYLPNGNYPITVSFPDGTTKYSKIVIQDQPKSIVIRAKNPSYETIAPDEIHTAPKFKSVTFGDGHGGAVSQNGDLYTWGLNRYGSTGIGRISYTVDEIITPVKVLEHVAFADFGGESSAAVTENGDLYTWGWNRFGQLGYETEPVHTNDSYSTRPQKVELPGKVKALSMGSTNCAAILENGDLYTWGSVTKKTAAKIHRIYESYKHQGFVWQQYIACLDPLHAQPGSMDYSLTPEIYGTFLTDLFRLWSIDLQNGSQPYIRQFENYIGILLGYEPECCEQRGICSFQNVVEADGSVYPCDFYVLDEYKLGNLLTDDFAMIEERQRQSSFFEQLKHSSDTCAACKYFFLCRSGCRRHREQPEAAYGQNYFCRSYQMFFDACLPERKKLPYG